MTYGLLSKSSNLELGRPDPQGLTASATRLYLSRLTSESMKQAISRRSGQVRQDGELHSRILPDDIACPWSGGTASTGPLTTIPALFTIALSCVGNELASALRCSAFVTSSNTGEIRHGFVAVIARPSCSVRTPAMTSQPSAAICIAVDFPTPRAAPVINTEGKVSQPAEWQGLPVVTRRHLLDKTDSPIVDTRESDHHRQQ
jgi:hypothetical protein